MILRDLRVVHYYDNSTDYTQGNWRVLQHLWESGLPLDPDTRDAAAGATALHLAAAGSHSGAAQTLVLSGADPHAVTLYGRQTPLHCCAAGGVLQPAALLLPQQRQQQESKKGGGEGVVDSASTAAAAACGGGVTCQQQQQQQQSLLLVPAVPKPTVGNRVSSGRPFEGLLSVMTVLFSKGADPAAVDALGWQPLHWAAVRGSVAAAEGLLVVICEVDLTDSDCSSSSSDGGDQQDEEGEEQQQQQQGCVGEGVNAVTVREGWTPLHLASMLGHAAVVEVLMRELPVLVVSVCVCFVCFVFVGVGQGGGWRGGGRGGGGV